VPLLAYVAGYGVPEDGHPDAYPLSIASTILSQGRSSRIYQKLVYDTQLAIQAEASGNFTEDPNLFIVILILNQGASATDAEAALEAELTRIKTTPVTDEELAKARSTIRSQYTFGRQSVEDKASALGHGAVIHGDNATANTEYDLFMKVTKEDILRVAKQYFRPENRTVIVITPGQGEN
jgi:predicted Zn-dependent peptidase